MALDGSDYELFTGTARLAKLRSYCSALRAAITTPDASADGRSVSYATLKSLLDSAEAELRRSEQATKPFSGITLVRF